MNENIKKARLNEEIGEFFRINHVHNIHIDELFKINLDALERFYTKEKRIPGYAFESMENLLKTAGFLINEEEFRSISCYSKEIVIDEIREGYYLFIDRC